MLENTAGTSAGGVGEQGEVFGPGATKELVREHDGRIREVLGIIGKAMPEAGSVDVAVDTSSFAPEPGSPIREGSWNN